MSELARRGVLIGGALALSIIGGALPARGISTGVNSALFGSAGCNACHGGGIVPDVRLLGPASVTPGSLTEYTLEVDTVGAQDLGGFNVNASAGTFQVGGSNSANTYLLGGEVTHSSPKAPVSGTVRFSFLWQAPLSPGTATLTGWGNAVDGNGQVTNDRANVSAELFDINVQAAPTGFDSYKCYQGKDLKAPPLQKLKCPAGVQTSDQFSSECVDLQKVKYVCNPVSINGSAIVDPSAHLVCYQIKGASLEPRPTVEINTQFQTSRFELKKPKLICVPGTKVILP